MATEYGCLPDVASRREPCQHCGRVRILRARRICKSCYMTESVREQYPNVKEVHFTESCGTCGGAYYPAFPGDETCQRCRLGLTHPMILEANRLVPCVDAGPIQAHPGSSLKLAVLIVRAEKGMELFDEGDTL